MWKRDGLQSRWDGNGTRQDTAKVSFAQNLESDCLFCQENPAAPRQTDVWRMRTRGTKSGKSQRKKIENAGSPGLLHSQRPWRASIHLWATAAGRMNTLKVKASPALTCRSAPQFSQLHARTPAATTKPFHPWYKRIQTCITIHAYRCNKHTRMYTHTETDRQKMHACIRACIQTQRHTHIDTHTKTERERKSERERERERER